MTAEKEVILDLRDVTRADRLVVGTKAANLGELARAGFPVPGGFVLTARVFDDMLAGRAGRFAGADTSSPAIFAAPLPTEVVAALDAALAALGAPPLAVRSSAVGEDLPGASFAGQYQTVLGVRGMPALVNAVKVCFASAFSQQAVAYRAARGLGQGCSMAVLVQRLIPADAAGVAFTANPVTGDRGETLVSAVRGLGERLVSGRVSPDEWRLTGGRVICDQTPEGAVDAAQVMGIAKLARRVEEYFAQPQDVEWAIHAGRLFLLQARPITALPLGAVSTQSIHGALHKYLNRAEKAFEA
jgi:pyruvate,water dikinase